MFALVATLVAAAQVQVIVLDTRTGSNADAAQAALVVEETARSFPSEAFKVTTTAQLSAVLGLERQRQLLGCGEDSASCAAELASALGSDGVVQTTLARVDEALRCTVVMIAGTDGSALERLTVDAPSETALLARIHEEVGAAAARVYARLRPGSRIEPGQPGLRRYAWVPAAAGAALVVVGAVMFGVTAGTWSTLSSQDPLTVAQARGLADSGRTTQALGWAFSAVGGAALVAAAVVFAAGAPTEPRVVVGPVVSGSGGGVSISGVLP